MQDWFYPREMVKRFVESFNALTFQTPIAKIDLEVLRIATQSKVLAQCTEWIRLARLEMLAAVGVRVANFRLATIRELLS